METIGEAVDRLDAALFVGREREIATFRYWLNESPASPTILNIFGPGGIGKSTLIRAFLRLAQGQGRPALLADAHHFRISPDGLVRTLGESTLDAVVERLNRDGGLLVLDTFDAMGDLSRFLLEEFLPRLSTQVRVVIAGRYALGTQWHTPGALRLLVRSLPLGSLTKPESRDYLARRDIAEVSVVEQILAVAGGHPLTLSVAADLVQQFGVRDVRAAPEWKQALGALIEQVLRDVSDPGLRDLLDACAILRRFDEAMLAAMSERPSVRDTFDRFTRLSFVRPTTSGYILHDEVRRLLVEDLKNRRPDRYRELRNRAFSYLRRRMRYSAEERGTLLMDRFFLCENAFIQMFFFYEIEPGLTYLEDGDPDDTRDIVDSITRTMFDIIEEVEGIRPSAEFDYQQPNRDVSRLLSDPKLRIKVLRNIDGVPLGLLFWIPISQETLGSILDSSFHAPLLKSYLRTTDAADIAERAEDSDAYYMLYGGTISYPDLDTKQLFAELMREHFQLLAKGGFYLCSTLMRSQVGALDALGFKPVDDLEADWGGLPIHGMTLDLRRIGVDAWIEAITNGRPLPEPLPFADLESALHDALLHWQDTAHLNRSPLLGIPAMAFAETSDASALREMIVSRFRDAMSTAAGNDRSALKAVELSYLVPALSNEVAAERLRTSRPTYYRWLKRGITLLAREIDRPLP